ncbi:MAG: type II toxin-antitoxin system VapB family antitoxin [Methylocystis sp.]
MPLNIRDEEVNRLAEQLAGLTGKTKAEAAKIALQHELRRRRSQTPLWERCDPCATRSLLTPDTGVVINKAFFDALGGEGGA